MVWLGPEAMDGAGPSVVAEGIVSTTPIATPSGWRAAGTLAPGAQVLTFDNGPQEVMSAHLQPMSAIFPTLWPLLVPAWALDNREDLLLLPEQKVLIEANIAEDLYGDPFALIPAQALAGWRGIDRCRPPDSATAVVLGFAHSQLIYASRGVLLSQARHLVACMLAEEAGAALKAAGQRRLGMGAG